MALPTALTTSLAEFCTSVDLDAEHVSAALRALDAATRVAVPSYLGLQLVLHGSVGAVTLTLLPTGAELVGVVASLRVPLALLSPPATPADGSLVLYAARPGALVDLAADLTFTLSPDRPQSSGADPLALDEDLTPSTTVPGLTGAAESSSLNRAVGLLIDLGHEPDEAVAVLGREARANGLSMLAHADQLLRSARTDRG